MTSADLNPQWFALVVSVAAFVVAIWAWQTNVTSLRNSYRPVLRPVPWFRERQPTPAGDQLLLKNIGNGPAISVVLYRLGPPLTILGDVEVVEKLGARREDPADPNARDGRERLRIESSQRLTVGQDYHVAYQDVAGDWHLTTFTVRERGFEPRMLGREHWRWALATQNQVPEAVKRHGQIVRAEDFKTW